MCSAKGNVDRIKLMQGSHRIVYLDLSCTSCTQVTCHPVIAVTATFADDTVRAVQAADKLHLFAHHDELPNHTLSKNTAIYLGPTEDAETEVEANFETSSDVWDTNLGLLQKNHHQTD